MNAFLIMRLLRTYTPSQTLPQTLPQTSDLHNYYQKPAKATCRVCPAMNYRSLRTLLEAVAITVCLLMIVGHQSEVGIMSQVTTNRTVTLVAEQNSHCALTQADYK